MPTRIMGLIFSTAFSLVAGLIGWRASTWYVNSPIIKDNPPFPHSAEIYTAAFGLLGLLIGFSVASVFFRQLLDPAALQRIPARDKAAYLIGVIIGLVLTALISFLVWKIERVGPLLTLLVGIACIYISVAIALSMKEELYYFFPGLQAERLESSSEAEPPRRSKLLDTNVIIDGRITDICRAGFLEGPIYVPGFVLEELHLIADSADGLKRNRGRRGLDILNQMQKDPKIQLSIYDHYNIPLSESEGVDMKLIRVAKDLEAALVTNDFNLNKVAVLQGISVLNVNELANAVKPVVLPGEEMTVTVVREGKELNQGVAYLDDGTMVVIEQGKSHIGETLPIVVSSLWQTAAGKMIFANLRENGNSQGGPRRTRQ